MNTLGAALTLLALAAGPRLTPVVETRVGIIDANEVVCGETGRAILNQLVFLDFCWEGREILAWKMHDAKVQVYPYRGVWRAVWLDNGVLRRVTCEAYGQSWLLYDYEIAAREWVKPEERRGL